MDAFARVLGDGRGARSPLDADDAKSLRWLRGEVARGELTAPLAELARCGRLTPAQPRALALLHDVHAHVFARAQVRFSELGAMALDSTGIWPAVADRVLYYRGSPDHLDGAGALPPARRVLHLWPDGHRRRFGHVGVDAATVCGKQAPSNWSWGLAPRGAWAQPAPFFARRCRACLRRAELAGPDVDEHPVSFLLPAEFGARLLDTARRASCARAVELIVSESADDLGSALIAAVQDAFTGELLRQASAVARENPSEVIDRALLPVARRMLRERVGEAVFRRATDRLATDGWLWEMFLAGSLGGDPARDEFPDAFARARARLGHCFYGVETLIHVAAREDRQLRIPHPQ